MRTKHFLMITGNIKASCACGQWHYSGIDASTRQAIGEIYAFHSIGLKPKKKKTKTKRRKK